MKINKNIVMPGMRRKVTFIKLTIFRRERWRRRRCSIWSIVTGMRYIRDRPFNLNEGEGGVCFFVSFRNNFSNNTRVRIFLLFVAQRRCSICSIVTGMRYIIQDRHIDFPAWIWHLTLFSILRVAIPLICYGSII
jgi:hypothetical protein